MGFDYTALNILDECGDYLCPSCGYNNSFEGRSFDKNGPLIGTGICSCCMYEPGLDDVTAASGCHFDEPIDALRAYSEKWRASGSLWRGSNATMPVSWDADEQKARWAKYCQSILS